MDTAGLRSSSDASPSVRWSLYAGVYALIWAAGLLLWLRPISDTIGNALALPTGSPGLLLAVPVPAIGAVTWWAVIERREAYTYPLGGTVGLLTAVFTVLLWALQLVFVYGALALRTGGFLVVAVLALTVPIGFAAGLPLTYARRRLTGEPSDGTERAL